MQRSCPWWKGTMCSSSLLPTVLQRGTSRDVSCMICCSAMVEQKKGQSWVCSGWKSHLCAQGSTWIHPHGRCWSLLDPGDCISRGKGHQARLWARLSSPPAARAFSSGAWEPSTPLPPITPPLSPATETQSAGLGREGP